jgi:hypothetical protein
MSKLKNDRVLFEKLQDECPEVDDLSLKRILETLESAGVSVGKNSSVSTSSRGRPEEFRCDRANAVSALRELDASRDQDVVEIRRIDEGLRKRVLATILQRAKVSGIIKEPSDLRLDVSDVLRLPGFVHERPGETLILPLSAFQDIDPLIAAFLARVTRVASRISDDYCIDSDYALIYLLLEMGYRSKPQVAWTVESRKDRPGLTRIHMSIDPWSSSEEVAAAYAKARCASGHSGLRAQRAKTYRLAQQFATYALVGLIDPDKPDWRLLIRVWETFCLEYEFFDWSYCVNRGFRDQVIYQFARDVRHAVSTLRDTAKHRRSTAKQYDPSSPS